MLPSPSEHLAPHQVHLWCAAVPGAEVPHLHPRYAELMAPHEVAQHKRFMFDKDKRRYLTTRALVRTVLSRYAPVAPQDWAFEPNEYGRPAIANADEAARRLRFNVSHTDGLVVLGITSGREIGVDTESVQRQAPLDVADRFFSARESSALRALPAPLQAARFWDLWTFKESYIKARGMGLSLPLDGFSFLLDDAARVAISFEPHLDDDPARWAFWQFRPDASHLLAVCLARDGGPAPEFTLRTIEPLGAEALLAARPVRTP